MTGADRFLGGLREKGLACESRSPLVLVDLDVGPPGAATPFRVGTDPPGDFPNVPPHWLHLPREFVLPGGEGVQNSELGPDWRRWSRPHPKWTPGAGVDVWLAHARSLVLRAHKP